MPTSSQLNRSVTDRRFTLSQHNGTARASSLPHVRQSPTGVSAKIFFWPKGTASSRDGGLCVKARLAYPGPLVPEKPDPRSAWSGPQPPQFDALVDPRGKTSPKDLRALLVIATEDLALFS
jgi:hypothetical protein